MLLLHSEYVISESLRQKKYIHNNNMHKQLKFLKNKEIFVDGQ